MGFTSSNPGAATHNLSLPGRAGPATRGVVRRAHRYGTSIAMHAASRSRVLQFAALLALLLGLLALIDPLHAAAPVEGKWWGKIGSERERIDVGLEFLRNGEGRLELRLTQPISNYYGVDPGGETTLDGDRITNAGLHLDLRLVDGQLLGTFPGPNSPAQLERTRTLPQAPKPPRVPIGPSPRWEMRLNGQVRASPVVFEDRIYIGTSGGVFNAIDARDGKIAWAFPTGCPIHGAAAVDQDAVLVVCDGALFRLARSDGKEVWRYDLGDRGQARVLPHPQVFDWDWQAPQPLVADGIVYVGSGDGGFHAIDANTGLRRWRFDTRGAIRNGAAIDGERVIFGSRDNHVYALDRKDGRERWRFDTGAPIDATPVVHAGRVLIGNRGVGLHSLDTASGELDWRLYFWGSWVESTPIVLDDTIYIGSSDLRRVSEIDPRDGKVKWRTDVFGWTFGTPLVIGDRIHVGAAGGTPYFIPHRASYSVLERATGRVLSRRELPDTGGNQWGIVGSLARAGDLVVFATLGGSLFAYPID
jgi:outer membrane protein assembly factor BamB